MSHIARINLQIKSLPALAAAANALGLHFREGQTTFKYYRDKRGRCEHVLAVRDNTDAYEMGIVARLDGSGYDLLWDNFLGGQGLCDKVGRDCELLKQQYGVQVGMEDMIAQGLDVWTETDAEGNIFVYGEEYA